MTNEVSGAVRSGAAPIVGAGRYPRYPAYKDSGIEWLGDIPSHWRVLQLGRLGTLIKCNGGTKADELIEGIPCVRYGDLYTYHAGFIRTIHSCVSLDRAPDYTPIQYGDILFAASGETIDEIGKSAVNLMETDACCGGDVILLRTSLDVDATFMGYATDSPQATFQKGGMGRGITVMHVYSDQLKYLSLAIPSVDEQRSISTVLDRDIAKIDALVAKKERLVELLREKRTALITRAVTKGLDPDVPMKDTGVKWLGEIPAHWEIVALRRRWEIIDCKHVTVPFVDQGIPLASVRETQSFELNLSNARYTTCEWYAMLIEGKRSPRRGDLVYCRNVSVGSATFVNTDERFAMGQDVCTIRSAWENQRWLNYYLCSNTMSNQLATILVGSTFDRINVSEIRELITPVPPRQQQDDITAFLDCESAKIDALVTKVREAIDRLKELRTALISAAVTGKIDVRETPD